MTFEFDSFRNANRRFRLEIWLVVAQRPLDVATRMPVSTGTMAFHVDEIT